VIVVFSSQLQIAHIGKQLDDASFMGKEICAIITAQIGYGEAKNR